MNDAAFHPLRLADKERDVAMNALANAFADGRLSQEVFEERAGAVMHATTVGDLEPLFADLPGGIPLVQDDEGGLQPRPGHDTTLEPAEHERDVLMTKGRKAETVDGIAFVVALGGFLLARLVFHMPHAWLFWVLGLVISLVGSTILGYDDKDKKIYDGLKAQAEAERAERLRIANEHRRELGA